MPKKKHFFIILIVLITIFLENKAQEVADNSLFSPKQLQDDATFIFSRLKWYHPDMYHYCGLEIFEKKKHDIFQKLNRPMTREEFLMIIGTINSCLDAHSEINVRLGSYVYRWIDSVYNKGSVIFPRVYVENSKLYTDIKGRRMELLSVNGVEVQNILSFMKQYIGMTTVRNSEYVVEGYFAIWAYTYYNIRPPFEVTYIKGNRIWKENLHGITLDEFKRFSCLYAKDTLLQYAVYPSSSIAILTVNTFDYNLLNKIGYDKILKSFSDSIRQCNIRHLFVDVSKNGGGQQSEMLKLFDYLHHDTVYFKYASFTRRTEEDDVLYRPYQSEVVRLPNKDGFKGQLYILQGVNTCSGADFFCRIVAQNRLGGLIGQNTGNLAKNFTYTITNTNMPNTKTIFGSASVLMDFSHDSDTESLIPNMLWDVDYTKEFSEKELIEICNRWNEKNQIN